MAKSFKELMIESQGATSSFHMTNYKDINNAVKKVRTAKHELFKVLDKLIDESSGADQEYLKEVVWAVEYSLHWINFDSKNVSNHLSAIVKKKIK